MSNGSGYSVAVIKKANLYIDILRNRWMDRPKSWDTDALRATLCDLIYSCCGDCVPFEGEPKFVLLGRDPQAPDLILEWAETRLKIEPTSVEKCVRARTVAQDMAMWKATTLTMGVDGEAYQNYRDSRSSAVKWVITDGPGDRFAEWENGPSWTSDIKKALKFADRESAERYCADDEDAWRVVTIPDHTHVTEDQRRTVATAIELYIVDSIKQVPRQLRRVADTYPDGHWDRNVLSFIADLLDPPHTSGVPRADILKGMLELPLSLARGEVPNAVPATIRMTIDDPSVLAEAQAIGTALGLTGQTTHLEELPRSGPPLVDNTDAATALQLFREFVSLNAAQWVMGAGSGLHPVWELIANAIENGPEILPEADLKRGIAWAFIQPNNRKSWPELLQEGELED